MWGLRQARCLFVFVFVHVSRQISKENGRHRLGEVCAVVCHAHRHLNKRVLGSACVLFAIARATMYVRARAHV